jgi:hypothetical protein
MDASVADRRQARGPDMAFIPPRTRYIVAEPFSIQGERVEG